MTTLTASEARAKLYKLLDEAASSHQPIQITGKRANAVLISEDDWRSIQETLYLLLRRDTRSLDDFAVLLDVAAHQLA